MPYSGLTSFLLCSHRTDEFSSGQCQCPIAGLPHFYPTPSESQCLCGFQRLFLQVFFRIFWKIAKTRGKSGQEPDCIYSGTIRRGILYIWLYLKSRRKQPWRDSPLESQTFICNIQHLNKWENRCLLCNLLLHRLLVGWSSRRRAWLLLILEMRFHFWSVHLTRTILLRNSETNVIIISFL